MEFALKANLVLALVFSELVSHVPISIGQTMGSFARIGDMLTARTRHTATLLPDGRVLITGGIGSGYDALVSAELYDPCTGTFTAAGNMATARRSHTATLLPDGRVLIAGGIGSGYVSAELYDPSTGTFTPTGDMIWGGSASGGGLAMLLPNGKVFIASNLGAELYDPVSGTFAATGPYADERPGLYTATLLPDGRVLITGCDLARCEAGVTELYDPMSDTFSRTGSMSEWYSVNKAPLLMNGKVLIVGTSELGIPVEAEEYDPATGTFAGIGETIWPHEFTTATLLPDGTILVTGALLSGGGGVGSFGAELYDPVLQTFSTAGSMMTMPRPHNATLLKSGKVLMTGNSAAELYDPPVSLPAPMLFSVSGDGQGQGTILHAGTDQVASESNPAVVGETLEIYCAGLSDGSVIPPQISIGGRMAELLSFGKAPGLSDMNKVNVRVPNGVAAGPAVSVRMTYLGRYSNEVSIAVR